ncbi:hypothetical protein K449DRAFT_419343 [Hypoxylon sp. EC38]|nr:hypothetical protein K449DRAFT_419343 [Hypoxylon sp. EC38]
MKISSVQDLGTPYSLAEETEKKWAEQRNAKGDLVSLPLGKLIARRIGTFSPRSSTPSVDDSVFDHCTTETVYSAVTSASSGDYHLPGAQATGLGKSHSTNDDERSSLYRTPELGGFPNASPLNPDILRRSLELAPVLHKGRPDIPPNPTHQSRPEEADSEPEDDYFDSEDEGDNDEWNGEPDRIETAVLTHVEDLGFATWLIMKLHSDQVHIKEERIGGPRKRQRLSDSNGQGSDNGGGEERDEGDGDGDRSPEDQDDGSASGGRKGRQYACPFNKADPDRFCDNSNTGIQFRSCASGVKTIQRLKEQIERKHLVIQCNRCFKNFSEIGKSHAETMAELDQHNRQPEPCTPAHSEASLGVSMERWVLLERNGSRKRPCQRVPELDKWYHIWDTIYPGRPRPSRPYCDRDRTHYPGGESGPASGNTRRFFELFESTLDYCIGSGNIRFEEPVMRDPLNSLVRRLYNVHSSISEPPSLANTSSSSLTGTQLAIPRTPVLENQDPTSLSQRHILNPKLKSHGRRPLHIPEPHTGTAVGLDSQTHFIIPSHIPPNMPYGTPNFNSYGDQLAGVAPTLPATQHPYAYYMNDGWTNLQYPVPRDPEG